MFLFSFLIYGSLLIGVVDCGFNGFNFFQKKKEFPKPTPLENMLIEKQKAKDNLFMLSDITEKDLATLDRIFDDIVEVQITPTNTFEILLYCFLLFKSKQVIRKTNKGNVTSTTTKKKSLPIFFILVLLQFTRNVKPAE